MIDTRLGGRPADLREAAYYLSQTLAAGVAELAERVTAQRATLERGWEGVAGEAFTSRAAVLARTADDVGGAVGAMGRQLDALASTLSTVQLGLAAVRAEAAAAGLELAGEKILPPLAGPVQPGSLLAEGVARQASAYEAARTRRDELVGQWTDELRGTASFVESNATTIGQVTSGLLAAAYSGYLKQRLAEVMTGQAAEKLIESHRLSTYYDDLVDGLRSGRIAPYAGVYDDLDELTGGSRQAAEESRAATKAAADPKLPSVLGRGLGLVGPLGAGYGIYDDIAHGGESPEQAVVSQGGGLLAGAAAGALAGGAVGTMGLPVLGTIVGAGVGAAVGVMASQRIDHHYESEEAAADAEDRARDEERVQQVINLSEGRPPCAAPGSDQPAWGTGR